LIFPAEPRTQEQCDASSIDDMHGISAERQAHGSQNDQAIHIEDDDATGAVKTGAMRWVLAIGLLLAIVVMSLVWIVPALTP
jgi:hypothetical protein